MTRHPFRWESLAFGAFFLAVVGNWAVWKQDLLTTRQLSLGTSAVLILLGLAGVAATLWQARDARTTTHEPLTNPEGHDHEAANPQS